MSKYATLENTWNINNEKGGYDCCCATGDGGATACWDRIQNPPEDCASETQPGKMVFQHNCGKVKCDWCKGGP